MRIAVSGTHASGKSTLISDFHDAHPEYLVLGDPFDDLDLDDPAGEASFATQLRSSAERIRETAQLPDVIAERCPLDFVAYLLALHELDRSSGALLPRATALATEALADIDLVVLLPLDDRRPIEVPDDEDPQLREETDRVLLDLADEWEQDGMTRFLTIGGDREARRRALLVAVDD